MNQFQKVILISSSIILVVSLIFLAYFLTKSLYEGSYPPVISDCPDYWDVTIDNDGNRSCVNTSTINEVSGVHSSLDECSNPSVIDQFMGSGNDSDGVLCEKYNWSKKCNVVWDGISNNNKACHLDYN
jgi:hypothetical protein